MADCEDEEVQSSLGEVAPDNIRQKYLYKNVKGLYNVVKLIQLRFLWRNDIVEAIARLFDRH